MQCPPRCLHGSTSALAPRGKHLCPIAARARLPLFPSGHRVCCCLILGDPGAFTARGYACASGTMSSGSLHSLPCCHSFSYHVTVLEIFSSLLSFFLCACCTNGFMQVRSYFTHPCRHELCILPLEGNKSHFSHLEPSAGKSLNPDTSSYQTTQDDFSYKVKDVY